MDLLKKTKTIRRKISKRVASVKRSFKKKRKRKKEKKKKKRFFAFWGPCCVLPIIIILGLGLLFVGDDIDWFNGEEGIVLDIPWARPIVPAPDGDDGDVEEEEEETYYQLGLEFPVRPEDIDVLMDNTNVSYFGGEPVIETMALAPIGRATSANDYKPGDMFFVNMFYGDGLNNISFSAVVTVGEAIDITVYWDNVVIEELLSVTWIADGSGVRWDYP